MCIRLFLCEIWALCEFICSSQLCNRSTSRHITPSSTVWAFSTQQQQSGSRAVAAESTRSQTSLHHWWCLENVLIIQLFQISLPVPAVFLPVCLVQSVPGPWCCVWVWPSTDPVTPGAAWEGWMAAGWASPSAAPLHSPSHSPAWISQAAGLHSQPHPWLQAAEAEQSLLSYRNWCKEIFFPPEKCCPFFFRLCL